MKTVLTIAGSDCSGGAGIQADLKTFAAHGVYGMSVITALTAQNTTGVYGISEVSPNFVGQQMDCIMNDIPPDAIKIGMVSSVEIIEMIGQKLKDYGVKQLVLDPVMVSTSGSRLLNDNAIDALKTKLFPLAALITPNIPEAQCLTGMTVSSEEDMVACAVKIAEEYNGAILIKGGHFGDEANDLLYSKGKIQWYRGERIDNPNTHGTGCTLSSAIASQLALGHPMDVAVAQGKDYIHRALKADLDLGKGRGPLNHCI